MQTEEEKREYKKQWRIKNKEKIKAQRREYCDNHKEEIKEREKQYRDTHKEEKRKYAKQYRDNHKEKIAEQRKQYYINNKELHQKCYKKYYNSHKESRKKLSRKQVLKRHDVTLQQYNEIFNKQNGKCAICNKHQNELKTTLHIDHDHMTGKIRGLLCMKCNRGIGYLDDDINILLKAIEYLK